MLCKVVFGIKNELTTIKVEASRIKTKWIVV